MMQYKKLFKIKEFRNNDIFPIHRLFLIGEFYEYTLHKHQIIPDRTSTKCPNMTIILPGNFSL